MQTAAVDENIAPGTPEHDEEELKKRAREREITEAAIQNGLKQPSPLLFILHEINDAISYIPEDSVFRIAETLQVPVPELLSTITFHRQFKVPMGEAEGPDARHVIRVCSGAPCFVNGSQDIQEKISELLDLRKGEVSKDKKFAFEVVDCLGACGMSPVMMIDEDVYGNITADQLPDFLAKYE